MGLAAVLSLSAPASDQKTMQEHFRKLAAQKTGKGAEAEEEGKGTGSDDGSKEPTAEPAKPDDDDDEEEEFNAFAFWRAPLPPPAPPAPAEELPAPAQPTAEAPPPRATHHVLSFSSVQTHLDVPPLGERLQRFEADWKAAHGGKLPAAAEIPTEVADLYELYFSQRPQAAAAAAARARARAEDEATDAAQKAARAAARAQEWSAFEESKGKAWSEARAQVWEQRAEVVGGSADAARALSGAATFLKEEEAPPPAAGREAYLQQMRDKLGIAQPQETDPDAEWAVTRRAGGARGGRDGAAEFDAAERCAWAARGGAAADAAAREEAWAEAEAARREVGGAAAMG